MKCMVELKGPTSKVSQTYRTNSWAFSGGFRLRLRVNPSASQSARSFFFCWYCLCIFQVALLHNRKMLGWRPLRWILWWNRLREIALMIQNGFLMFLLSSQRGIISWKERSIFLLKIMCRVAPNPLLPGGLPDEHLDGTAYWSLRWDQSSRACGQVTSKILISLKSEGVGLFKYFFGWEGQIRSQISKKRLRRSGCFLDSQANP